MDSPILIQACRNVALAAALAISLVACGDNGTQSDGGQLKTAASTTSAISADATSTASITTLTKVSETRFDRTKFDYVYKVTLANGSTAMNNPTATITSAGAGVTIVDGTASFGIVGVGATATSTDTITLRMDRTVPFKPTELVWSIQNESSAQTLARLESEGKIPTLDRSTSLAGPDSNNNGIRDDIDAHLTKLALTQQQKRAAEQLARAFQSAVTINSSVPEQTTAIDDSIRDAISCAWSRLPTVPGTNVTTASQLVRELQRLTANTEARVRSYLKYNASRDGTVSSLPQGDRCVP